MTNRAERLARWDALPRPLVTPSLLNCDFGRVRDELDALGRAGFTAVHLDVMDGRFVPNLSYGPPVIASWRKWTDFPFDAHLMIAEPGRYVDDFARVGCDLILVHIEVLPDPRPVLDRIRSLGCRAGLVVNPPTPFEAIAPFVEPSVDLVDTVLVMSVMPGFGGQSFDPSSLSKVRSLRALRPDLNISIDGGINPDTIAGAVAAGASQLVVGSFTFRPDGRYEESRRQLAAAIE